MLSADSRAGATSLHRRLPGPPSIPKPPPLASSSWANSQRPVAWWLNLSELWWTRAAGARAVERAAQTRLEALVRHAREFSPLYRDAYRGLPNGVPALHQLPVMTKGALMARFDDWSTDRSIRRASVERFVTDRAKVGDRYLDRYIVWKSSGSTGTPGIYIQDDAALAVYDALVAVQLTRADLALRSVGG